MHAVRAVCYALLLTVMKFFRELTTRPSTHAKPDGPAEPCCARCALLQAVMKFFRELYANADEDMQRAMLKSYQESGGCFCKSFGWA